MLLPYRVTILLLLVTANINVIFELTKKYRFIFLCFYMICLNQ
nr:MAG TPA: hypothetical protein [Caudoviricetes sp.]